MMETIARRISASKGKLLVVDDDLTQRTVIGTLGAKLGYDAVMASTFETASNLLRTESFDAMTLDLALGERDGIEILRLAAELKLNTMPIVIVSGLEERFMTMTRRIAEALDLSITACLTKPLGLDEVRRALEMPAPPRKAADGGAFLPAIDRERVVKGLQQNEFFVEFQPKVDLRTRRVVGCEALARWRTADFGLVSPGEFIPRVEQFGLTPELTYAMLEAAIADGSKIIRNRADFTIAVNVSGSLMSDLSLPERIETVLRQYSVAPACLIVEVTESVAMSDIERAMDILLRLRIKGINAAIDDFGTGFSSLTALARFPFNELKIDQSFSARCGIDADMMKIVDASIALGHAFGMKVVAEGVDRAETETILRKAGCDIGQGHFFARAMDVVGFTRWMRHWESQRCDRSPSASRGAGERQPSMIAGRPNARNLIGAA